MPDTLIRLLPAIYQDPVANRFLYGVLDGFETLFLELQEKIAAVPDHLDPDRTPREFLDWLAGWVGVTLLAEFDEPRRRQVIREVMPLYRIRGTARSIEWMVQLFTGRPAHVREPEDVQFEVGVRSTVGVDTILGGPPAHTFEVLLEIPHREGMDPEEFRHAVGVARAAIDLAKPAHTAYMLRVSG
jgi:phage tail-like protein